MPDSATVPASPVNDFFQKLGIDLKLSGQLPIEGLVIKILDVIQTNRETMNPATRDRFDVLAVTVLENWHDGLVDLANKAGANFKKVGELTKP